MGRVLVLFPILFGLFWSVSVRAQSRTVAVTVDDLPYAGPGVLAPSDADVAKEINRKLLSALKRHHVPVTGFVIQQRVEELGARASTQILRKWTMGEFTLGNHSYSHRDANDLSIAQIEDAVIRGETGLVPLMKQAGKKLEFFRFPMNHTGDTEQKHDQVAAFLAQHGYRVATCTIENSDYLFNKVYIQMLTTQDSYARRLPKEYLSYTSAEIDYYAGLSKEVLGYEPPQVMLLHANRLNADLIEHLLALFEKKHYSFVSLKRAQADPAYQIPDTYITSYGPMWGYRWAAERGVKVNGKLEPEPPEWIFQFGKKP